MPHQVGFRYGHRIFCRIGFFLSDGEGILDSVFGSNIDFGNSDKVELVEKFALSEINRAISQGMVRGSGFSLLRRQVGMYCLQLKEVSGAIQTETCGCLYFRVIKYKHFGFINSSAQTRVLLLSGNEARQTTLNQECCSMSGCK